MATVVVAALLADSMVAMVVASVAVLAMAESVEVAAVVVS